MQLNFLFPFLSLQCRLFLIFQKKNIYIYIIFIEGMFWRRGNGMMLKGYSAPLKEQSCCYQLQIWFCDWWSRIQNCYCAGILRGFLAIILSRHGGILTSSFPYTPLLFPVLSVEAAASGLFISHLGNPHCFPPPIDPHYPCSIRFPLPP